MTRTSSSKAAASRKAVKRKRIRCPEITEYMRLVETGKVEACVEQHQLVAYTRRIFAEENLVIDFERIEGYRRIEALFPFKLHPYEWFAFTLFFCVFKTDGRPRWDEEFLYGGRGLGKNGYASFVSMCSVSRTCGIPEYNVDICANSEDQAKTSFMDVHDLLDSDKRRFEKSFTWNLEEIANKSTKGVIKYRTNSPSSRDGMRTGIAVFDEIHAYQNWKNINVFTTGLGKKPHPRRLYITTDGFIRDGVLDSLLSKARKILRGEKPDNGFLPIIFKLDNPEEVHDESKWPKANPRLPYSEDLLVEIRKEYIDFLENPANCLDFMTKRMNLPQGEPDLEVASWDDILATNREMPDLAGMPCVCGIDFAKTTDFVSAVLLFREDETYYVVHHSWFCTRSKDRPRIKVPLEEFAAKGMLTLVDEVEVHPSLVAQWLLEQTCRYDVRKVAIDSYRYTLMSRALEEVGFREKDKSVVLTRPSNQMLVQPTINSAFVNHNIVWGDDPLMRWFTNNTCLVSAAHGNYTFGKIEEKSRKTDGFMAFVAAMAVEDAIPRYREIPMIPPIVI